MKKFVSVLLITFTFMSITPTPSWAANTAKHGTITGKTIVHGLASLVIWPGLGQYLNDNESKKNITHALLGLTGIFRLWSGWDAMIDRTGGCWDGKV